MCGVYVSVTYKTSSVGQVRIALFSDRALCALRLGWWLACVADCSSSIAENGLDAYRVDREPSRARASRVRSG